MRSIQGLVRKTLRYAKHHKKTTIAVVCLLIIAAYFLRPKPQSPLDTVRVAPQTLTQVVSVSGSIDASKKVDIAFLTSGKLMYVGVKKNDTVTAGQVVAQLDARTTEKNLETALLNYSEQRNSYDQTISNNNNIANPEDALSANMKRILQNNQYDLQKAVTSVELQDLAQQQSVLTSPITGVVTRADAVSAGTTATPTTLFEIIDPSSLVFSMDVDEADIGKIKQGQLATISLDAYPNESFKLSVSSIDYGSHTTSNGGTAYTVKVELPGNDINRFRLGLNGNADIITAQKQHVLTVPLASLFDDTYVYVQNKGNYEKRKLRLGLQNDTDVEVLSGLHTGESIVLQPSKVPQKQIVKAPSNI